MRFGDSVDRELVRCVAASALLVSAWTFFFAAREMEVFVITQRSGDSVSDSEARTRCLLIIIIPRSCFPPQTHSNEIVSQGMSTQHDQAHVAGHDLVDCARETREQVTGQ